ncbi:MAG: hypothetical protein IJN09_03000 [Oscillospiraceae bacterium]|nr:hypothetical protein [Oscillospiraceae bacterium]
MNSKATKAALVTSLTSLVLCFTMLMGTTLAWFVDRVESTNNRIEAGNLEVDLVMRKGGEYVSIADGSGDLFAEAEGADSISWQPGTTKTLYLGIRNTGSLPVKYEAVINVLNGGLLGVLNYSITDIGTTPPIGEIATVSDDSIRQGKIVTTAQSLLLGKGTLEAVVEDPVARELHADETHYYAFTVHMENDAGQEYQKQTISLGITVKATQANFNENGNVTGDDSLVLSPDDEKVETISATAWKLKTEVADFSFLEKTEDEDESEKIIFPEETEISDGDNTYPLSALRVISLEDAKLLATVPVVNEENRTDEAGTEAETEAPTEKVFVYYQKTVETTETDETVKDISGWYLLELESVQTALSDKNADLTNLFEGKEPITEAEKLPVITFPDAEEDVLKNTDIINWLYNSAELLPAAEDNN